MAYVSLYRKYRPQSFADVVGQQHVIRTLVHAIEEERLHHAYLFTGPRGTGKTSTARLLAKAINCEQGPTPEPCGTCDHCIAITEGSSVDVIELDMASHGGVDDARELRDRALYAPARARRKVYILDEVHMASTAAFNALLKLIEEPPAHVLFAMATTDPQKVLPTILSRVQRLDLRRVAAPDVAGNVRRICDAEGYRIDDGAVDAVVRAGDGSLRDTQSVLEQVLAFAGAGVDGHGGEVSAELVGQVLGHTPADRVFDTVDLVAGRDLAGLLAMVQGLLDEGHDLRRFTLDLVQHLRDLLVLQVAPDRPDLVDATDERRRRLQAQTAALPRASLLRAVGLLADTVVEQRQGSPRLPLELTLARLAVPGADGDVGDLADRVGRLEAGGVTRPATAAPSSATVSSGESPMQARARARSKGTPPPTPADPTAPATTQESPTPPEAPATQEPSTPPAPAAAAEPTASASDDGELLRRNWEGVLEIVKTRSRRSHAVFLPATVVGVSRGIVTLRYARRYASFHAQNAGKGEFVDVLKEAIERACGLRLRIDIVVEGDDDRRRPMPPSVTPDDARTPVLDDDPAEDGPTESEVADVREAEAAAAAPVEAAQTDELLAQELGAELLEERPAAGQD